MNALFKVVDRWYVQYTLNIRLLWDFLAQNTLKEVNYTAKT